MRKISTKNQSLKNTAFGSRASVPGGACAPAHRRCKPPWQPKIRATGGDLSSGGQAAST
jgi:hypothetical protein